MEEVQGRMDMAMRMVDACSGSSDAPLSTIMQAADAAATAAASAATLVSLRGKDFMARSPSDYTGHLLGHKAESAVHRTGPSLLWNSSHEE